MVSVCVINIIVEPLNKGHWGQYKFCCFVPYREVVLSLEVLNVWKLQGMVVFETQSSVICRRSVPFSEGPLLEVLLYTIMSWHW